MTDPRYVVPGQVVPGHAVPGHAVPNAGSRVDASRVDASRVDASPSVCLLASSLRSTPGLRLVDEARALCAAGFAVTVVSTTPLDEAAALLGECALRSVPRQPGWRGRLRTWGAFVREARQVRAPWIHAHCTVGLMLAGWWVAHRTRARFCGDFNEVLVLARHRLGIAPEAPPDRYERSEHWEARPDSPSEQSRVAATLAAVPQGLSRILDVGCGDGTVTRRLTGHAQRVIALDQARVPLRALPDALRAVAASATALPLATGSVCCVLTTECLEHRDDVSLGRCVAELGRVAERTVVLGVPQAEQLPAQSLRCVVCRTRFHVNGHHQRFTGRRLARLLPGHALTRLIECGAEQRFTYHPLLLWIRQRVGGVWARKPHTVCPRCGQDLGPTALRERNAISLWCDRRNRLHRERAGPRRSHLVAVFERR